MNVNSETRKSLARIKRGLSMAFLAISLVACGGGGGDSKAISSDSQLRPLPESFTQGEAVAYSPYRTATMDATAITDENVRQDLNLLVKAGVKMIRLFDSSDAVAKRTLRLIKDEDIKLKVMLGLWMNSNAETLNLAEIDRGIALANTYQSLVLALSVGNETLVAWSGQRQEAANLARYIKLVRDRVSQPVTTDDNWAVLAGQSGEQNVQVVLSNIDFVAMHTYPLVDTIYNPNLWNWKQEGVPAADRAAAMMNAAIERAKLEYNAVKSNLASLGFQNMPIVVGETGWKAVASGGETLRAHPVNQKMYWERLKAWKTSGTGPANIVLFAAFDEPWKQSDDKWGLFNVNRQARCAVQGLSNDFVAEAGSCAADQALHYVAVQNNGAVTASRYTVYADAVTAGEAKPAVVPVLNAWENGTTARAEGVSNDADASDGPNSWRIVPNPAAWGWGMTFAISDNPEDLSQFDTSNGKLNFSIKTTNYPGKIEVGFLTGTAADASLYDVYLAISPGQYGYLADGNWNRVSIPISALKLSGAPAFGVRNSVLDLTKVTNPFVIGDRYDKTGNTNTAKPSILVDAIYWSK